ncbi:hypothetical protein [Rhodonellum sp.]|uniref:hypothetical protein n=1 Tax=Rhodonellum sp. TaxID=2231180 RepID=UPI00271FE811|nr:hypothetical protein [Rhodonellum sp.]MDO9554524.1 hypothetical protein [Rhodonellum sp.]
MEYYINDIALSTFGIIPGQAKTKGSNLALSGHLDFPKRINKTSHSWGDRDGIEPYVSTEEMQFAGRDIDFHFLLEADSVTSAHAKIFGLYSLIEGLTGLATLSCDFGSWSVFVRDEIQITDLGRGALSGVIPFKEPVCDLSGLVPTEPNPDLIEGIDGVSWSSLGFALVDFRQLGISSSSIEGMLNRPKPKSGEFNSYATEGFQITKTGARKYKLIGGIEAVDYETLKTIISGLYALFGSAGTRVLYLSGDLIRIVYCEEGFEIDQVVLDYKATARITINFTEATEYVSSENWQFLGDTVGNYVGTTEGQKILIRI